MTSSTINFLCFLLILKPLLNEKILSTLSAKIVSTFKILPISYPITMPPIAGESIKLKSLNSCLIFSARERHRSLACSGLLKSLAH